jgi:trehalose 6-phosphate synthase/phosphatase
LSLTKSRRSVGVKPQRYLDGCQWPETKWRVGELAEQLKGKTVLLGLDDMDVFKGIEMKLLAFERVLEIHEDWRGRLVLVQITSPPRGNSKEIKVLTHFQRLGPPCLCFTCA